MKKNSMAGNSTTGKIFKIVFQLALSCGILLAAIIVLLISYYSISLPNINILEDFKYPTTTRLYSDDGLLLKEYAEEKRIFVDIDKIPDIVKNAFISAEDKNFYRHNGLDLESIISAFFHNTIAFFRRTQMRGGSTITQQVVKNVLLTNERTITRKIKEAILSYRITKIYSKDKVLEVYLNYIFLGNNSYGVAAACLSYFNKSIYDITIDEAAILASLPKAPGKLNPANNKKGAKLRRNYVIDRMYENGYITKKEAEENKEKEIVLSNRKSYEYFNAGAFSEDTRKKLLTIFDEKTVLKGGISVTTTIRPDFQKILDENLKNGIEEYDRRHGYRGELGNIYAGNEKDFSGNWSSRLNDFKIEKYYRESWEKAVVLDFDDEKNNIVIGLINNKNTNYMDDKKYKLDEINVRESVVVFEELQWLVAPESLKLTNRVDEKLVDGNNLPLKDFKITKAREANLRKGSVILVLNIGGKYRVRQIPEVNGAAVVMDVNTGRIFAMVGGYHDSESNFNRVTQANRQLGSIIKPLVYLSAFENGYNGTDRIMDEEIILPQGDGEPPYKPKNFSNTYYGLVTLRKALQSSYNVSTVRLSSQIGLGKVAEIMRRFEVNKKPKRVYSMALGSLESRLIDIVNAYGMIVNGGLQIQRETIEKIQDSRGKILYKRDKRDCEKCNINDENINEGEIEVPFIKDERKRLTDNASAYQITSILEGVVKYGTGGMGRTIGKIVGGKTGTSNSFKDAWFIGFSPDIILGIYIGFDDNRTLGQGETGAKTALPTFVNSMKEILKDYESIPFRVPENIVLKRVDMTTGEFPNLATNERNIIYEAFKINDPKRKKIEQKRIVETNEFNIETYNDELSDTQSEDSDEEDIFSTKNKIEKIKTKLKDEEGNKNSTSFVEEDITYYE